MPSPFLPEHADELVKRFANRAGEVSKMPGFEAFELLRPTDGKDIFLRVHALAFDRGLRQLGEQPRVPARPPPHNTQGPVSTGSRRARVRRGPRGVRVTGGSTADRPASAQLTGPGGPFEIVVEDVVGHPTQVYKQRMRSMRELMAQNAARADVAWLVQGDRRSPTASTIASHACSRSRLSALGVRRGDRVALVLGEHPRVGASPSGRARSSARRWCR